jgi:multidrug efflux pump subunit AcrB
MAHRPDSWIIEHTHNTARFFTENRHIAWMVLIGTVIWGVFGYLKMPQRKDPEVPVKVALAICAWPGVDALRVEELVTRRIEEAIAENVHIDEIKSTTRLGVAFVYVTLKQEVDDPAKEFDDLALRLEGLTDLPDGTTPINFIRDFGATSALMLTVASPKVGEAQVAIRARVIREAIERTRAEVSGNTPRTSLIYVIPEAVPAPAVRRALDLFLGAATADGTLRDTRSILGPGYVGVDAVTSLDDAQLLGYLRDFIERTMRAAETHPDAWPPVVIRDPAETEARLAATWPDKYSYRELEEYTDLIRRTLQTIPIVTKVARSGVLDEQILLGFSQERLASYGIQLGSLKDMLSARNVPVTGGTVEVQGRTVAISPTGEFTTEKEIGDVIIGSSKGGAPVYLRDLAEVMRTYDNPPDFLNYFSWQDTTGQWQRGRAVTVSVQMRTGAKIAEFGLEVDSALSKLRDRLPEDLILARTSDEPRQVVEKIDLFMNSLVEAIVLVVLVALLGFWEWRSAAVLSLSIPLTLAMTFGMMALLGIDLQQVSIASLIIALGLLVDDPVVAGDAIKRDLAIGHPPLIAAWLGPTKLATAILYATITNIAAYLPFLLLTGDMGRFLYSLPIVLTCSLVASRVVSMTFIPLLGYYLLRPGTRPERPMSERRTRGFTGWYYRVGKRAIEHRWRFLGAAVAVFIVGGFVGSRIKSQFLPKDLAYIFTIDVWLPEDAALTATQETAAQVEAMARAVADEYARQHGKEGERSVLRSVTTFVGGGGPRFWFAISPEPKQSNYAQIVLEVYDKHDTGHLVGMLQPVVASRVAGARVNVKELETGTPLASPVAIRITGDDMATLREHAERLKEVFRAIPLAERVQDDWGTESFRVRLVVDPDRANLAGVTNADVVGATAVAMNGYEVGTFREGDKQIPIVARLRPEERAQLTDVQNLYVYARQGSQRVPLRQISSLKYEMRPAKINRRNQFRTITIQCFPIEGRLASEVMASAAPGIRAVEAGLPAGYRLEIAGEQHEQEKGFGELGMVMALSIGLIYVALTVQFKNMVKPILVFAAIPFGMVGALVALWAMGMSFGFMAFLGVASLVGVIVSHVIVLFDFIEEAHERGEPFIEALLDAGIVRLRPVLITVGATVLALFPLASHGGPFWEPMCYAQIGGLTFATVVTLLLVPVLYAIFVLDLKWIRWEQADGRTG